MNHAVSGAVCGRCKGGGVIGTGAREIRKSAAIDGDIGYIEVGRRLREGEGDGVYFASFQRVDARA